MPVVLVLGSTGAGKRALVQALITSLEPESAEQQQPPSSHSGTSRNDVQGEHHDTPPSTRMTMSDRQVFVERANAVFDAYSTSITTKYYSVQVSLWRQTQANIPILALRSAEELDGVEGIIVVFDIRKDSSFEEAAQWSAFVDEREQCAFRVCVGSKRDLLPEDAEEALGGGAGLGAGVWAGTSSSAEAAKGTAEDGCGSAAAVSEGLQARRRRAMDWCLDHGFEYVEADCRDSRRGGETREKEGVPRIVEALQSNVWNEMEFCTESRPLLVAGAAGGSSRGSGGEHRQACSVNSGSSSSNIEDETGLTPSSAAAGGEEREVSEYLSGFVSGGDGGDGAYGYDVLDSGGEQEEDDGEEHGDSGGETAGRVAADPCRDSGTRVSTGGAGRGGQEAGGGRTRGSEEACCSPAPLEIDRMSGTGAGVAQGDSRHVCGRSEGGGVESAHIELQALWEAPVAADPVDNSTTTAGGEAASTRPDRQEPGRSEPGMEVGAGPERDGDESAPTSGLVADDADAAAAATLGANPASDGFARRGDVGGGSEVKDAQASSSEHEQHLLETARSMLGERLGGVEDFEGDEMERLIGEARKVRELGGTVSDAERRSRAANVAMRLAALLGDFGDDDSGGDEGNDR